MKKLLFSMIVIAAAFTAIARSGKSGVIPYGEYVQMKSTPEFVETGRWTIGLEALYNDISLKLYTTNDFGMILSWQTVGTQLSTYKLRKVPVDTIDGINNSPVNYTWEPITPADISITISGDGTVEANQEGSVSITGDDGQYIVNKIVAFNNYTAGKSIALWCGNTRSFENELFEEWYGYVRNRATNNLVTINKGYNHCGGLVCSNDYIWSNLDFRYSIGSAYSDHLYVPKRAVSFRMLSTGNAIRNSGNAIGSRVSLNCFHYNDVARVAYANCNYNHKWMKPDGTTGIVHASKASSLSEWAKLKGIYSDDEVSACNDILAYVYDVTNSVPSECQAYIIQGTTNDAPPEAYNCVNFYKGPAFHITQHGTLQPSYLQCIYRSEDMKNTYSSINDGSTTINWQDSENDAVIAKNALNTWRHDSVSYGSIYPYHYPHVCDSGRPMFYIYGGEPLLQSTFHYAGSGPSFSVAWRIIRDFCLENDSTCNLFDVTTKTKKVVGP